MPSDSAASLPVASAPADERLPSPAPPPTTPVDALLRSILARARAAGFLDAEGRILTDRWPDDMRA